MEEGTPIDVGDGDFDDEVLDSDVPVLVDFWAPWCGPCRAAAPVLERVAKKYAGRLKVCKLNVGEQGQIAVRYHVASIPTLYVFKHGQVVDQLVGVTTRYESDLKKMVEPHLGER